MSTNTTKQNGHPEWLNTVLREAAVRRVLILHGNVQDIFYDPLQRQYVTLSELLSRMLAIDGTLGFSMIGRWDQADGLRFIEVKMLEEFQQGLGDGAEGAADTAGEGYDVGETESDNGRSPQNTGLYADPAELILAIRGIMETPSNRPAIILNWSHLMVTQAAHPDPAERQWILNVAKAIHGDGVISMNTDELRRTKGLLIFIAANLGSLPPVLYQGDPRARLIAVPRPSRPQRHAFFVRHNDDLRCEEPKSTDKQAAVGAGGAGRQQRAETLADMTDQFKLVDLKQILSLSLRTGTPLSPGRLLNLYRFGEKTSPWEELSEEKLQDVDATLKQRVVGQDDAVDRVATMIIRAYMGLAGLQHSGRRCKPKGTLFFVGPTGVGKTELAKTCAEFLFGDESACIRFDMSEYNHEHSDQRLVGAPPGYVGFEEGGQLTNAVRQRPFCVLLFDEVEKAHGRVLDKFLQILEDGRLTDGRGETSYFSECVIIFTSNIGASDMPQTDDAELIRNHFIAAVENHFVRELNRPELLNRLGDNVVVFDKITNDGFRKAILTRKLEPLATYLGERFGVKLNLSEEVEDRFLKNSRSEHGGRGILNIMERHLINPLARFLFHRKHQLRSGRTVQVTWEAEGPAFDLLEDE